MKDSYFTVLSNQSEAFNVPSPRLDDLACVSERSVCLSLVAVCGLARNRFVQTRFHSSIQPCVCPTDLIVTHTPVTVTSPSSPSSP